MNDSGNDNKPTGLNVAYESFDPLTGIFDQDTFFKIARMLIDGNSDGYYVFSFLNIDNFKIINDRFGIGVGDAVLKYVASVIKDFAAAVGGICGRLFADNFALLYPHSCVESKEMNDAHERIHHPDALSQPIRLRTGRYFVENKDDSVMTMFDRARIAANFVRNSYDKEISVFDKDMLDHIIRRQLIVENMNTALASGEFKLFFQPQYNHATGAIMGAEVLVRWLKNGEYVLPGEFIPVFEENDFIYKLDKYVWERACILLRKWMNEGKNPVPVSVNVSRRDILHDDFIDVITAITSKYDIPVDMFRLEITESAFSESTKEIISKANELAKLGYVVEIDDFGSGYSSLNSLKDVDASVLKLDMKFFEGGGNAQRAGNIVESIVRMARWLGMTVIAEGVEDVKEADYLKSVGCYYIQGYLYSKPLPVGEYEKLFCNENKEYVMSRLQTLKNLNNNEFWDPKSMETLIFNSYVGGACIFEYRNGITEVLRTSDEYVKQFGSIKIDPADIKNLTFSDYLYADDKIRFLNDIKKCISSDRQVSGEYKIHSGNAVEYVRVTLRNIAKADDTFLMYGVMVNQTEQRLAEIAKRDASTQLASIVDNFDGGVIVAVVRSLLDMDAVFVNDGFYKMFGYTREQYRAESVSVADLIFPDDKSLLSEKLRELSIGSGCKVCECRCVKRDGTVIWTRWTYVPMSLESVNGQTLMCVVQDITAGKEVDGQLKILNEAANEMSAQPDCNIAITHILQKTASYFGGDGAYVIELDKNKTSVKNTYEVGDSESQKYVNKLRTLSADIVCELVKETSSEKFIFADNESEFSVPALKALFDGGAVRSVILSALMRDGAVIGFMAVNNPSKEIDRIKHIVPLGDYITVLLIRRDLAKSIESEKQSMAKLLDDIPESFMRLKLMSDGRLVPIYLNNATKSLIGMTDEQFTEVYGKNAIEGLHPDDIPLAREAFLKAFESGDGIGRVYRLRCGDGSYLPVRLKCKVTVGADDEKFLNVYYSGTNTSIERRDVEIELLNDLPCGAGFFAFNGVDIDTWFLNKAYQKFIGRIVSEKDDKYAHFDFVHPDDRERVLKILNRATVTGDNPSYNLRIKCSDGKYKEFKVCVSLRKRSQNNWLLMAVYVPV